MHPGLQKRPERSGRFYQISVSFDGRVRFFHRTVWVLCNWAVDQPLRHRFAAGAAEGARNTKHGGTVSGDDWAEAEGLDV